MSRNQYVAKLVREYADEWVRDPSLMMSKDEFQAKTAEKWAVEESIKAIETYDGPPSEALVDLSRTLVNAYGNWMMVIARDVVEDIYYYVCEIS